MTTINKPCFSLNHLNCKDLNYCNINRIKKYKNRWKERNWWLKYVDRITPKLGNEKLISLFIHEINDYIIIIKQNIKKTYKCDYLIDKLELLQQMPFKIPIKLIKINDIPIKYKRVHIYINNLLCELKCDYIHIGGLFYKYIEFINCIKRLGIENKMLFESALFEKEIPEYVFSNYELSYIHKC